jgi:hypothetical protein
LCPAWIADRVWREDVRELGNFGFEESWDSAVVCGNEMDLRIYVEPELGKHPYAYCTFKGCLWWLEFRRGSVLSVRCRSLSGEAIDDVVCSLQRHVPTLRRLSREMSYFRRQGHPPAVDQRPKKEVESCRICIGAAVWAGGERRSSPSPSASWWWEDCQLF